MPRVHTAKANKDYPKHGIKKGQQYWHWAFFRGPKQMSATPPRRSQTTGSGKLSNLYAAEEALEDAIAAATEPADVASALEDAATAADECATEYDDAISNLQEAFQGGCPAIEEAEEVKGNIETWKDELDTAKGEVEGLDASDYQEGVEDYADLSPEKQEEMLDAAKELASAVSLEA